jgi:hypothetical protein
MKKMTMTKAFTLAAAALTAASLIGIIFGAHQQLLIFGASAALTAVLYNESKEEEKKNRKTN